MFNKYEKKWVKKANKANWYTPTPPSNVDYTADTPVELTKKADGSYALPDIKAFNVFMSIAGVEMGALSSAINHLDLEMCKATMPAYNEYHVTTFSQLLKFKDNNVSVTVSHRPMFTDTVYITEEMMDILLKKGKNWRMVEKLANIEQRADKIEKLINE